MLSNEIRSQFLDYFKKNSHRIVPSAPVVPQDDPTLLFLNAGMNQFKDVFLGKSARDYTRAVSSQKCIRVGGKHNDLENVGHTARHLTFFEMLGNFSFGDYFKEEAIRFAWEVSTEVFGFAPERIWPTVFREDDEAFELWRAYVPEERITRFDEDENFWSMGDTGPCGPCSELLYDKGPEFGEGSNPKEDVKGDRFLEFWNLVFMQYNRDLSGESTLLPKPSIDTGAGLERVVDLKMGARSVFETDTLRDLIAGVEALSGVSYDPLDPQRSPTFHVIADHLRCLSFAIADGAQPSNMDRGYVLRKVLRRAVRYGRNLGLEKPFMAQLFPRLLSSMGEAYPELGTAQDKICELLTVEEESFLRTLRRGGNILNQIIDQAGKSQGHISGEDAFKLKDTYGLPLEEIQLIAKDNDLDVDLKEYRKLEEEARERSRAVHKTTSQVASENLFEQIAKDCGASTYMGYKDVDCVAEVQALVLDGKSVTELEEGQKGLIVLNQSPFYAEMGGQVGDTGRLLAENVEVQVYDCKAPFKGIIAHEGCVEKGTLKVGDHVHAHIDAKRRGHIARNHTATHLLHWALYEVLGDHVRQAGSEVSDRRLRFDFHHHKAMTEEELQGIEDLINEKIRENIEVSKYELSYEDVQKRADIKQFFGDKYGDTVRVVDADFSKELCGGIHVNRLGDIGYFRIVKESSIAAGVRRIEATTGRDAEVFVREEEDLIRQIAQEVKSKPGKVLEQVRKLVESHKALEKQLKDLAQEQMESLAKDLCKQAEKKDDLHLIVAEVDVSSKELRSLGDSILGKIRQGVIVLASGAEGKCGLFVRCSDEAMQKGFKAGELIQVIAPVVDGRGGGKADAAQAGGKSPEKISLALEKARELLQI